MTQQPKVRFAVGTFDSWSRLGDALRDAQRRRLALESLNCLALQRTFAGKTFVARGRERVVIHNSGAHSLRDALGHWLIPRHAACFQDAVHGGKILFWIRVADPEEERRAYQNLLAHSSNSVGVHDLVLPR